MKYALAALAFALSGTAFAQHGHGGGSGSGGFGSGVMPGTERGSGAMQGMGAEHRGTHVGTAADALSEGEVRAVDFSAGKITLSHGPVASMDVPAMTMVYRARDARMLDTLSVGDKVRFAAEKAGDAFTLTRIERKD